MTDHSITIVDYGMGNIGSVVNMIRKAGGNPVVSANADEIFNAKKLLLPGVGAFDSGMQRLIDSKLDITIKETVLEKCTPLLGICLGMQLLFDESEEGSMQGLHLMKGKVQGFKPLDTGLKVPHMGWNAINIKNDNSLVANSEGSRFYFVHSYYVECDDQTNVVATTPYIVDFTSVVNKGNIYGAQFHPEKSHKFGLNLFRNFLAL